MQNFFRMAFKYSKKGKKRLYGKFFVFLREKIDCQSVTVTERREKNVLDGVVVYKLNDGCGKFFFGTTWILDMDMYALF